MRPWISLAISFIFAFSIVERAFFMKYLSFFVGLLAFFAAFALRAQEYPFSIHREESERYRRLGIRPEEWQHINAPSVPAFERGADDCTLNKRVFGWHPYWSNGLETHYQWNLLSDLCYFSYEVNPQDGNPLNTYSWSTANVVTQALARGVRVHLCVTLFSDHATFFSRTTAQQNLINNLIALLKQRGAHGVNIDFELVPLAQKAALTDFMIALSTQMKNQLPGAELSIALPAVDWSGVFDVATMAPYVDLFIVMGYDYYWSGSPVAGPVDPLYSFSSTFNYNLSRSITTYLRAGVPRHKLLLGLPYYGREWETSGPQIPSNTTGNFSAARTYRNVRNSPSTYQQRQDHYPSASSCFVYQTGPNVWRQCFINSEYTLARRYQLALQRDLGGIGIWALGYDAGYSELWDLLRDHFTNCAQQPCADTIYDGGGPAWNYYNFEDYTFTIAPPNANGLNVRFLSFELENDYDTLWIYDGPSTAAPLLGAWTGTQSPGLLQASGNSLTFRFVSDGATTGPGWVAVYECAPISQVPSLRASHARVHLFPNPAPGAFSLRFDEPLSGPIELQMFDAQGRLLHAASLPHPTTGQTLHVTLPPGQYPVGPCWLRLRTPDHLWNGCVMLY